MYTGGGKQMLLQEDKYICVEFKRRQETLYIRSV
jgi:hypothetical protein